MPHILLPEEISKKYREAIVHYSKYQYAGIIETEASFKATRISIEQNCTLQAASYLNNVVLINLSLSEQEKVCNINIMQKTYKAYKDVIQIEYFRLIDLPHYQICTQALVSIGKHHSVCDWLPLVMYHKIILIRTGNNVIT